MVFWESTQFPICRHSNVHNKNFAEQNTDTLIFRNLQRLGLVPDPMLLEQAGLRIEHFELRFHKISVSEKRFGVLCGKHIDVRFCRRMVRSEVFASNDSAP